MADMGVTWVQHFTRCDKVRNSCIALWTFCIAQLDCLRQVSVGKIKEGCRRNLTGKKNYELDKQQPNKHSNYKREAISCEETTCMQPAVTCFFQAKGRETKQISKQTPGSIEDRDEQGQHTDTFRECSHQSNLSDLHQLACKHHKEHTTKQ